MAEYYRNPKIKNVAIDYNSMDRYEDRCNKEHKADYGVSAIGYHKAMELLAMAMEGLVPNGTYSDMEVEVWSGFRTVLYYEGLKDIYER